MEHIFPKENSKRVEHVPTKNIKRVEHVHIIKKVVVELNSFINAYLLVNDFLCSLNGLKEQFIIALCYPHVLQDLIETLRLKRTFVY